MDSALQNSCFIKKNIWSIVDLQCCVSFRYTAQWISYTYTPLFRFFSHIGHCCCMVAEVCPSPCDHMDCRFPRILCPWNSPSKNTGVGWHFLFKRIFPNPDWTCVSCFGRQNLYHWAMWKAHIGHYRVKVTAFFMSLPFLVNLGWFSGAYCLEHKLLHVLGFQGLALPHLYIFVSSYLSSIPQPLGSSSTSVSQGVVLGDPLVLFVCLLVCLAFSS